jgi:hypothetical protein
MEYGYSWESMRRAQAAKKAEGKKVTQAQANRGAQGSSLANFRALYDADESLMKGNSVDATTVNPQAYVADSNRAAEAFIAALKSAGHELSEQGLKKFLEYLQHHRVGDVILDFRRVDVLVTAFNRFSELGGFTDGDFKGKSVPQSQPRDRDEAERQEYINDLRKELGEVKFKQLYGTINPFGARRKTFIP